MKFLPFFAVLFAFAYQAQAVNYYLKANGSDANTGLSVAQAWKNPAKINALDLNPGDSVLFKAGDTFNGVIYLETEDDGLPASPVHFGTYGGTARADLVVGDSDGFRVIDAGGISIANINFVGNGLTSPVGLSGVTFFNNSAVQGTKIAYIFIKNISVSGFRGTGLAFWGFSEGSGWKDVTILNSEFFHNGEAGILTNGSVILGPNDSVLDYAHKNFRISYCKVNNNDGIPTVTDRHTGNGIVMRKIAKLVVDHCEAGYNGGSNPYLYNGPSGIWTTQCRDVLFEFNEAHHNQTRGNTDGGGFDFDGGTCNGLMQYNYSHDNDGGGFLIAQFGTATRMDTTVFRYNVTQNDGRKNNYGGITLWSQDQNNGGVDHCYIYNNIVYIKQSPAPWGYNPAVFMASPFLFKTYFMNNVFYSEIGQISNTVYRPGVNFLGNIYLAPRGVTRNFSMAGRNFVRLDSMQANNQERWNGVNYGIFTDTSFVLSSLKMPGFGNAPTINNPDSLSAVLGRYYKIGAGSPLIDAGFDTRLIGMPSIATHDFFGVPMNPFLGSAPNIGIDESSPVVGITDVAKSKAQTIEVLQQGNEILVNYISDFNQNALLQLIDASGKILIQKPVYLTTTKNQLTIALGELPQSFVVVRLITARGTTPTAKLILN